MIETAGFDACIHGTPLGELNYRGSINEVDPKYINEPLPIPVGDKMTMVGHAISLHVAWPKVLVIAEDILVSVFACYLYCLLFKYLLYLCMIKIQDTNYASSVPMPSRVARLWAYVDNNWDKNDSQSLELESNILGLHTNLLLFKDDIKEFSYMQQIGASVITVYYM